MMKNHHRMWLSVRVSLYPPVAVDSIWRLISFSDPQPPHQPHHLLLTKYRKFDAMKLPRRHGFGSSLSWSLHYSSSEPIGKPSEPILQSIGFEFPIGTAIGAFHPSSSGRNRWRRSSCLQPNIRRYSFANKIASVSESAEAVDKSQLRPVRRSHLLRSKYPADARLQPGVRFY